MVQKSSEKFEPAFSLSCPASAKVDRRLQKSNLRSSDPGVVIRVALRKHALFNPQFISTYFKITFKNSEVWTTKSWSPKSRHRPTSLPLPWKTRASKTRSNSLLPPGTCKVSVSSFCHSISIPFILLSSHATLSVSRHSVNLQREYQFTSQLRPERRFSRLRSASRRSTSKS